VHNIL